MTCNLRWPSYGKPYLESSCETIVKEMLPGDLEITISPGMIALPDYGKIMFRLHAYNLFHIDHSYLSSVQWVNHPEGIVKASLSGEVAIVEFKPSSFKQIDPKTVTWLNDFQQDVIAQGGTAFLLYLKMKKDLLHLNYPMHTI